jgi:hypothetical protein
MPTIPATHSNMYYFGDGILDLQRFREEAEKKASHGADAVVIHHHRYREHCQGKQHEVFWPPNQENAFVRREEF